MTDSWSDFVRSRTDAARGSAVSGTGLSADLSGWAGGLSGTGAVERRVDTPLGTGLGSAGSSMAAIDARADKPTPLSRWYATCQSVTGKRATVVIDDDSNGASTITIPTENASPVAGDRVIVDFRPDGLALVTAVV